MTVPHAEIGKALDKVWRWHCEERKAALARAKVKGVADGYLCEHCGDLTIKPDVDHQIVRGIKPGSRNAAGGETWDDYIDRLFCPRNRLNILCRVCHSLKTKEDKKGMRKNG